MWQLTYLTPVNHYYTWQSLLRCLILTTQGIKLIILGHTWVLLTVWDKTVFFHFTMWPKVMKMVCYAWFFTRQLQVIYHVALYVWRKMKLSLIRQNFIFSYQRGVKFTGNEIPWENEHYFVDFLYKVISVAMKMWYIFLFT